MENQDTLGILKQLERGEISANEADAKLNTPPPVERVETPPFNRTQLPAWIQYVGIWSIFGGVLTVVFGTWIIASTAYTNIFWFLIGLPIVLLGAFVIAIGSSAFSGHWLYINVENSRKRRNHVRFGIPFPLGLLRLALWFMPFIPQRAPARVNVSTSKINFNALWENPNELFDAIERELREGRGITIDVDDKDERVQVYIV